MQRFSSYVGDDRVRFRESGSKMNNGRHEFPVIMLDLNPFRAGSSVALGYISQKFPDKVFGSFVLFIYGGTIPMIMNSYDNNIYLISLDFATALIEY